MSFKLPFVSASVLLCNLRSAVPLRYRRARLAAVMCPVLGLELYRQRAATVNAISGRVASATYIREPKITWYSFISLLSRRGDVSFNVNLSHYGEYRSEGRGMEA